jgi:hypothetical protein
MIGEGYYVAFERSTLCHTHHAVCGNLELG